MVSITSSISETVVTPSLAKIHKDAVNAWKFSHAFQNIDFPLSNVDGLYGTWSLPLRAITTKAVKAKDLSGPSLWAIVWIGRYLQNWCLVKHQDEVATLTYSIICYYRTMELKQTSICCLRFQKLSILKYPKILQSMKDMHKDYNHITLRCPNSDCPNPILSHMVSMKS